jgi:ribonuclease-3
MKAKRDLFSLELSIGHRFADRELLELALVHVSFTRPGALRTPSNQRLEFLGDRVLGLAVSDLLYQTFPAAAEGELARRLSDLVRRETCAEVAQAWDVGPHIRLGNSEAQTGGRAKPAILADVCEALIGAVFLDAGFAAARAVVERAWSPRLLLAVGDRRDAKTLLQEWAQGRGLPAPSYREVARNGPDHRLEFTVCVEVLGLAPADGRGHSKREAEQAAAETFLKREGVLSSHDADPA